MRWKITLVFGLMLLLVLTVSAREVNYEVNTLEGVEVYLATLNADAVYSSIDSKLIKPNETMDGTFKTVLESDDMIDLYTLVKKHDVKIFMKRFEDFQITGNTVYLNLEDDDKAQISNEPLVEGAVETGEEVEVEGNDSVEGNESEEVVVLDSENEEVESEEEVENSSAENSQVTGLAALGDATGNVTSFIMEVKYYLLSGIVLIIAGLLVFRYRNKLGSGRGKSKENESDDRPPSVFGAQISDAEKNLIRAKKELAEVEAEFGKVKDKEGRLEVARRKLEEDKAELDRLQKGEER